MVVVWKLLSTKTDDPDRPGLYRDYLDAWDFEFDVFVGPIGDQYGAAFKASWSRPE
jgi:hypothetical protein